MLYSSAVAALSSSAQRFYNCFQELSGVKEGKMTEKLHSYIARRSNEVGQQIRQTRQEKGWTQEEAAQVLNCSRRRFNRVEQGYVQLGFAEIEALARAFGVPTSVLLGENREMSRSRPVAPLQQP